MFDFLKKLNPLAQGRKTYTVGTAIGVAVTCALSGVAVPPVAVGALVVGGIAAIRSAWAKACN